MKYFEVISVGKWFRITVVGYLLGMIVAILVDQIFPNRAISLLICGIILGYWQYRVLKERFAISYLWILTYPIGILIGLLTDTFIGATESLNGMEHSGGTSLMFYTIHGSIIIDVLQSLILKKKGFKKPFAMLITAPITGLVVMLPFIIGRYTQFAGEESSTNNELLQAFAPLLRVLVIVCVNSAFQSIAFKYVQDQSREEMELPDDKWVSWRQVMKEKEESL